MPVPRRNRPACRGGLTSPDPVTALQRPASGTGRPPAVIAVKNPQDEPQDSEQQEHYARHQSHDQASQGSGRSDHPNSRGGSRIRGAAVCGGWRRFPGQGANQQLSFPLHAQKRSSTNSRLQSTFVRNALGRCSFCQTREVPRQVIHAILPPRSAMCCQRPQRAVTVGCYRRILGPGGLVARQR
jgi:hypothetical protein